jgi:hypothetical protein
MILHPAVVVHGLGQLRAALRPGLPTTVLSAPGAAVFAGCMWWRALIGQGRTEYPLARFDDVLDCADAPGQAMAALRIGQRVLLLDPACPAFAAVNACASTVGAIVLPTRPAALDLAQPGSERSLLAWLRGDRTDALR